ncbi:uncharacterized protein J4E88_005833 [Alternaria novae-zelandiae]|uniref:uncharacterized protein n=1 Tax=Alternaria novae-zelandiae TaxID=430562 RepID=UPI0020C31490|nr:uncharacterized protein J4E88_005833 [Alternaria novae-zelandiae]KAI4679943.1 hypothetical protein J4E88_005833 [Alternaria novae-zelandiae]
MTRPKGTPNKHPRLSKPKPVKQPRPITPKKPRTYGPKPIPGPNGNKLKQAQYFRFAKNDIAIYHYHASFISVPKLRSLLNRPTHGFVCALRSDDPFCKKPVPAGDEIPPGCLEVGYLVDVFQLGGSALGFRTGDNVVEWLCFDRDIKASILDNLDIDAPTATGGMLFEHVADIGRSPTTSKCSRRLVWTEHRDWYDALERAGRIPMRVGVRWTGFGERLREEHLRKWVEAGGTLDAEGEVVRNGMLSAAGEVVRDEALSTEAEVRRDQQDQEDGGIMVTEADVARDDRAETITQAHQRDTDSPGTIGRRTPVFRDELPSQHFASPQSSKSNKSRSSGTSVLSDRSTNMRQKESLPLLPEKSKQELLLEGKYV